MQKTLPHTINAYELDRAIPVSDIWLRPLEKIKLRLRAEKYQYKEDKGGIAYIAETVRQGDTVFDIGSHKGGYLYFFLRQVGEHGRICAFEPQSVLNRYLLRLQQLLGWRNVSLESFAVSDSSGSALLTIPYNRGRVSSPCATILTANENGRYRSREKVQTISLDEYCSRRQLYPDFLKVDVEGNELSVFKGAIKLLKTRKPRILFECEARFVGEQQVADTFQFLHSLGYHGHFIKGSERKPLTEFSFHQHQQSPGTRDYCNNFIFE